jgi:flagellar secretion chaperone FliS
MLAHPSLAARQYTSVGIETGVNSANPHKLVAMLFEGAQIALADAIRCVFRGDSERKSHALGKAIAIITEGLLASLDRRVNDPLVEHLAQLYGYMARRLMLANAQENTDAIEEVKQLLQELGQAWDDIAPVRRQQKTITQFLPTPSHINGLPKKP